jgi:hypothetical protein
MSIKLEQLKKQQAKIEAFWERIKVKSVDGTDLRKWVVDSVVHFTEVGVSTNLIDLFIKRCEFQEDINGRTSHGIFKFNVFKFGYVLKNSGESRDTSPFIIPVQVALSVSRMLVDKYEEEERIVPRSLIRLFDTEKHQSIKLALEGIESNYQTKDPNGMLGPLVTAAELICRLAPEVEKEKNVSACLNKFYEEKLYEKYHIKKEIIWGLNTARIIRNEEVVHTKPEYAGNNISMYEAVGYAHLLVLFTDSLLASGNVLYEEAK